MIPKARCLATASLLGLPVALFAHALVFGGQHAAGGALHNLALAGAAFGMFVILALRSRDVVQGSVLATRLRAKLPCFAALTVPGSLWFALLELSENSHTVPILAVAAAVLLASVAIRVALDILSRCVAAVAIVLRALAQFVCAFTESPQPLRAHSTVTLRSFAHTLRLFSRPPPAIS